MGIVGEGGPIGERRRRLLGAAATFLVFLVAGPPVGGGTTILTLIAIGAVPAGFADDIGTAFLFSLATVFVPVIVVGIVVATRDAVGRPVGATLASGIGAAAGVTWGLYLASEGTSGPLSILAFLGTMAATLTCWRLTRWPGSAP